MVKNNFDYSRIENIIGYKFKNKELLKNAFTHSSYANENKCKSNERLEFLGDSVLQFLVTKKLYNDYTLSEGQLSKFRQKLVSESPLAFIIEELELDKYLLKGKGESKNKFDSKSIKCDLFESLLGSIYLDGGLDVCENFVIKHLDSVFKQYGENLDFSDSKTALQERLVGNSVVYITRKEDMSGYFEYKSVVKINGVICGEGIGHNKKTAEQNAAKIALDKITKE